MKRTLLLCLVSCVAAAVSGCACNSWMVPPAYVCDSSGCGSCGGTACGPGACASAGEPACNDCGTACGGACSEPCETACGQCGGASPAACGPPCGPLTWLFAILTHGYCGQGCGEVWWGDWHGSPPDCSDPCNRCGEYTGSGAPAYDSGESCESCGTGQAGQVRQVGTPHLAARRTNSNMAGRQVRTKSGGGHVMGGSSQYAPFLMSTTDRAVNTNRPGSVPQATLPRRMPAHR